MEILLGLDMVAMVTSVDVEIVARWLASTLCICVCSCSVYSAGSCIATSCCVSEPGVGRESTTSAGLTERRLVGRLDPTDRMLD